LSSRFENGSGSKHHQQSIKLIIVINFIKSRDFVDNLHQFNIAPDSKVKVTTIVIIVMPLVS
jgi:hypothetical protein